MKVSCIIPAYNEEHRVANVIRAVRGHDLIDEIIVVNDGSTDGTRQVLEKEEGIRLISYEKNLGKSSAVMIALKEARNEIVMMVDSDLVGISHQNITDLITPVLNSTVDMTITMRENSLGLYKALGIDFVSGERVFYKKIIKDLDTVGTLKSYALEAFLNNIVIRDGLRLKVVYWNNVHLILKQEKIGWWKGTAGDMRMIGQIISTVGLVEIVSQLFKMRTMMMRYRS
jgi:glycosyltransferase involved in cell wall biosynthesis